MAIKVILAPLTAAASSQSVAKLAARLAREFEAQLVGLHIRPDPASAIPYVSDGLTADIVHELLATAQRTSAERSDAARKIFEKAVADEGVKESQLRWRDKTGQLGESVARIARLSDLTLIGKPDPQHDPASPGLIDDVLTRSGRPLLLVPRDIPAQLSERILVAWNGSAEAARALAAALPFMHRAKSVTIVTIGELRSGRPDASEAVSYLKAHEITAEIVAVDKKSGGVGQTLLDFTEQQQSTLMVLGAYSHSRWREMMLGGVTRTVVDAAELPVLMSH